MIFPRFAALSLATLAACTSSSPPAPLPPIDDTCSGPCPASKIKHLVVIVQENHTFDTHFGGYCKAPSGSSPTCTDGPACCEAGPAKDPAGTTPTNLDDDAMGGHGPDNGSACEIEETNGGKMDRFATASCGSPLNVAYADPRIIKPYWDLAAKGALGDRYFQPLQGGTSGNDIYFARASFLFTDNTLGPKGAIGATCSLAPTQQAFTETTIGDLLNAKSVPWTFYAEGYKAMSDAVAQQKCPGVPDDCAARLGFYPCLYDPSDVPFTYFASTRDNASTMKDLRVFTSDLAGGTLPAVSFVKAIGYKTEHPGLRNTLSAGVAFTTGIVDAVLSSRYRADTLVLLTYDEGGGYFDHVPPPPASTVDGKPYGTRVPMLAMGPFARRNFISHVVMEHSSVVKFIEWNWLGGVGQLGTRDAVVNNLGSLIDPAAAGVAVPEQ